VKTKTTCSERLDVNNVLDQDPTGTGDSFSQKPGIVGNVPCPRSVCTTRQRGCYTTTLPADLNFSYWPPRILLYPKYPRDLSSTRTNHHLLSLQRKRGSSSSSTIPYHAETTVTARRAQTLSPCDPDRRRNVFVVKHDADMDDDNKNKPKQHHGGGLHAAPMIQLLALSLQFLTCIISSFTRASFRT
jgi:hypothetical protein